MKKIIITMLIISIGVWASFSKSGNIVSDSITKLQWQDDAIGSSMNWQGAIDYCENTLKLGGYNDWRLPNKNELISIVDYSKYKPAIDSHFQNTISDYYWSSTSNARYTNSAWNVYFYNGDTSYDYKNNSYYVRCVRAG